MHVPINGLLADMIPRTLVTSRAVSPGEVPASPINWPPLASPLLPSLLLHLQLHVVLAGLLLLLIPPVGLRRESSNGGAGRQNTRCIRRSLFVQLVIRVLPNRWLLIHGLQHGFSGHVVGAWGP